MRRQRRIARRLEQLRVRLAREADDAGDHNIGVADALAQPVRRGHLGALGLQHPQHVRDLRLAAFDPQRKLLLPQHALVEQADRLVAETGSERADAQMAPAHGTGARQHRLLGSDELVEIIEDDRALDQRLAVVEHQSRYAPQRIIGRDLVGIAEGRPRLVLEGEPVEPQRNRDATDKGGIILADQEHGCPLLSFSGRADQFRREDRHRARKTFELEHCAGCNDWVQSPSWIERLMAAIAVSLRLYIVHCLIRLARTSFAAVSTRMCSLSVGALTPSFSAISSPQTPSSTRSPSACSRKCFLGSRSQSRIWRRRSLASARKATANFI